MSAGEAHAQLSRKIDDLLTTTYLVRDNAELVERLFDQLVSDLVQLTFLETHLDFEAGIIDLRDYQEQVETLTLQCRAVGLPHRP